MYSVINKDFKVLNVNKPFKYLIIKNFLNQNHLKKIDNYFNQVPSTLYVKESVPQSIIQSLDIYNLKNNDQFEIECVSNFDKSNKSLNNVKLKKIKLESKPNGQQGLNRVFIDTKNIHLFPEIVSLKNELVSKSFSKFLEDKLNKKLKDTRLKIELLRNKKNHFLIPHEDCVEKVISFLVYINFNNQPTESGIDIYELKDKNYNKITLNRKFSSFNKIKTIPFENNSCFVFSTSKNSWHGLDPGKKFNDRRVIQMNWITKDYSSFNDCFPIKL